VTARVEVESRGAVVFQRSFLPIWAAELDGRPVDVTLANLHRMAVEVPPGTHELRLFVERGTVLPGLAVSALGLALLALRLQRRRAAAAA
jgi:hypothetical protein